MMGRLPVQGTASPNLRCRCTHAACPQSRRMIAAGPCCRRSCSCMSPQLLGGQADISQSPLPDPAPIGNQASTSTGTHRLTDYSGNLGKPGICMRLGWWRLSWCYFVSHPKIRKRSCLCLCRGGSVHCGKTMASQVAQISTKTPFPLAIRLSSEVGIVHTPFLLFWKNGNKILQFLKECLMHHYTCPSRKPTGWRYPYLISFISFHCPHFPTHIHRVV